ncbi:iron-containing alcohol dehydrogenase family protein [Pseudalkalibacillus hwajinpoensis]|uniref:Iron-containing alcohol dehydrogenase family protein n=1 Tax=Guptibacillus hwajinpoensis TaxID=208199 RepID=A0A4U1MJX9_9BACL|nr:iron-containing alcohol dehydrogenase family protein [Pseudalkalibacillus hwajinpoensis]TKD70894.1 iron-containing alcohol dehydrogenase family protein [Pseudalkalibacillus hwajinpoensis]
MEPIQVRATPGYYECRVGVLQELPRLLHEGGFEKVFVISGERSWKAAREYFPDLSAYQVAYSTYSGECSGTEIVRQAELATIHGADLILGVGGGKVLDVAKAVGNEINKDVGLVPTLASTCAATTPLSVKYTEEGEFVTYTIFPRSTYLVLVEPEILLHSPVAYLRAGIGDTLAKWYEARALIEGLPSKPVPVQLAYEVAKSCRDVLVKDGEKAVHDQQNVQLSDAFIRVIETNLLSGGMVGGLGDRYGRIAGAHSIHNGLTHVQEAHTFLHGEKVAYGILVQLVLEGEWEEVRGLFDFYKEIGLPLSLESIGVEATNVERVSQVIADYATREGESIHFPASSAVRKEEVTEAILGLEALKVTLS